MALVVDNSVAMAWCFTDEVTPYTEAVLARVQVEGGIVPAIWRLESANVLVIGERRGRLTEAQLVLYRRILNELPLRLDAASLAETLDDVVFLAREHRITVYDASYLELALRRGLPLASQDTDLRAAARRTGVTLLE